MTKTQKFKDIPHFEIIKENETISIPSIFMFKGGFTELYSFLMACQELNCTVFFKNEDFVVKPFYDETTQLKLIIYMQTVTNPKFGNDYLRYLGNLDKMTW